MPLSVSPPYGRCVFPLWGFNATFPAAIYHHLFKNLSIFVSKAFPIVLGIRLPKAHRERLKT